MRIPRSVFAIGRYAVGLLLVAGSLALMSAPKKTQFTVHDRAYYAAADTVNFVRPGLKITIVSSTVDKDGTISIRYKLSDPKDQPLDLQGIQTPGTLSVRYVAAYIPKGETQYVTYNTRTSTSGGVTVTQATGDTTGTVTTVALGEYIYKFGLKAPATFDATASHRVSVYGSRNLTEFDLGTDYDDAVFDFVPNGAKVTVVRDVVRTESCNKCHDQLAFHGGSRRSMELCIMCHTPQTKDATGWDPDMPVMVHKIHMGDELPSVIAGTPYKLGNTDWSTVALPSNPRRCEVCHDPKSGAAQASNWITQPSRKDCGSCHDNVNFATGKNHANLPQTSDNQCKSCHFEKGEAELDVSIRGAHIIETQPPQAPGLVLKITKVENGVAGKAPTVTFTAKDKAGAPVTMAQLTGGLNRLGLVLAGPTSDYGMTNFGADVTSKGYVSENPVPTAKCSADGTCTYTFTHAIPTGSKGTFAIGIEGRRAYTIMPGTVREVGTEVGALNEVSYFSVDGSAVAARRKVVDLAKCNSCHAFLSLHGENRNQIDQCVLCHNSQENDGVRRVVALDPKDKAAPNQSVNFALMIHKIHTGEKLAEEGLSYTVVGFGGSHNEFNEVRYPVFTPGGRVGDTAKCYMCHITGTEAILPVDKLAVNDPQGMLTPAPATTSACTACHFERAVMAHAVKQIDPKFGESCATCHATGADFDATKVHAGK
jgi:OmcA/MtrC family decaheme c-type cytochrome